MCRSSRGADRTHMGTSKRLSVWGILAGVCTALSAPSASAQQHTATAQRPAAEVLAEASVEAQAVFQVDTQGAMRHRSSGFACPAGGEGVVLTRVDLGSLPGQTGADPAYCEYSDAEGVVGRIAFSRDAERADVLSHDFCRGLSERLRLRVGAGRLPGASNQLGPARMAALPVLPVKGQPVPLWRCSHIRAPGIIIFDAAALRAPNGWTLLALHTPRPPACCNGYRTVLPGSFSLMPLFLIGRSAEIPDSAFPHTIESLWGLYPNPDNFPR